MKYISPLDKYIDKMSAGEKVTCPKCGKGILFAENDEPPMTAHMIRCDQCNYRIIQG